MAQESSIRNELNMHANLHSVDYAKTAITLGVCAMLANYCFVAFIYVSSQIAERAYAPDFWFKSLIRFLLGSTLGFASVLIPSLLIASLLASKMLSNIEARYARILILALITLLTHVMLMLTLQRAFYFRFSLDIRSIVLLAFYLGIGVAVAIVTTDRQFHSPSQPSTLSDQECRT